MLKKIIALAALSVVASGVSAADYYVVVPVTGKTAPAPEISVALNSYTLPVAQVGVPYSGFDFKTVLQVTNDPAFSTSGVTWSVAPGLPGGFSLSSDGVLTGTPTTANEAGTLLEVTSAYKSKTVKQSYTLKVMQPGVTAANYRLLMHVEGQANGAATTSSFVDSSPTPISVASVGSATVDTTAATIGAGSIKLNNFWGGGSWGAAWVAFPVQTGGERRFAMGTEDFTVESFVKSSGFGCYGAQYFTYGAVDWTNNVWTRSWSVEATKNGNLAFKVFNDNGTEAFSLVSSTAIPTATWAHIGVSRKAGTVRLFINGQQVASGAYAGSTELTRFSDIPFVIGKPVTGGNGCSNGVHNFDEVRVLKGYGASSLPVPNSPYVPGTN